MLVSNIEAKSGLLVEYSFLVVR